MVRGVSLDDTHITIHNQMKKYNVQVSKGTIYTLEELAKDKNMEIGTAVRFLGRVKRIDALRDRVRVEDSKGHTVYVDSSLLVDVDIEINGLYTFVGEIVRKVIRFFSLNSNIALSLSHEKKTQIPPCVRARVLRRERDIDMKLYENALRVRRRYLENI